MNDSLRDRMRFVARSDIKTDGNEPRQKRLNTLQSIIENAARKTWDEATDRPTMEWECAAVYDENDDKAYKVFMATKNRVQIRNGWKIQLESEKRDGYLIMYVRRTD
jgi:hypothetical protein